MLKRLGELLLASFEEGNLADHSNDGADHGKDGAGAEGASKIEVWHIGEKKEIGGTAEAANNGKGNEASAESVSKIGVRILEFVERRN
jgi:hypothetical protein